MKIKRKRKVNPERERQRFSAEFKREAVRLLESEQTSCAIGAGTGCSPQPALQMAGPI